MRLIHFFCAIALALMPLTAYTQQYKNGGDLVINTTDVVTLSGKAVPDKLNGEKIYDPSFMVTPPAFPARDTNLHFYIVNALRDEFSKLPDGNYNFDISNVVVNKEGRIVYCTYRGVESALPKKRRVMVPDETQVLIENKLTSVLKNAPAMMPARKNAASVPFVIASLPPKACIQVKNHVARVF
ncbi:MAG: hypothetical protein V4649_09800 [Bacteroidota bacterium]